MEGPMRILLLVLALSGIIISSLALQVHYSTDIQPCSINEKWDCGSVNHSRFAVIGQIPVAAIGIAGYAFIGLLALLRKNRVLAVTSLLALGYALYLTHIEASILQMWCLYCVISQTIMILVALFSLVNVLLGRRRAFL
jgi:vitamin-K-epoxide reductase (warfarin-sensitive)